MKEYKNYKNECPRCRHDSAYCRVAVRGVQVTVRESLRHGCIRVRTGSLLHRA